MINDYEATIPVTSDARIPNESSMGNDDVISILNGLIETCKDGQEGFKLAAEGSDRSDLKSLLYEYSQQRAQFAGELQTLVRSLGGDPEKSGSVTGAIHREWINVKTAVLGSDEAAILDECGRGEDSAKNSYKTAAQESLPGYIHDVITDHLRSVMHAHDRIKALRDLANNSRSSTASSGRK